MSQSDFTEQDFTEQNEPSNYSKATQLAIAALAFTTLTVVTTKSIKFVIDRGGKQNNSSPLIEKLLSISGKIQSTKENFTDASKELEASLNWHNVYFENNQISKDIKHLKRNYHNVEKVWQAYSHNWSKEIKQIENKFGRVTANKFRTKTKNLQTLYDDFSKSVLSSIERSSKCYQMLETLNIFSKQLSGEELTSEIQDIINNINTVCESLELSFQKCQNLCKEVTPQ